METFNAEMLDVYAVLAVGCALAPILVRVKYLISATISSYLGSSNDEFDAAMGEFALAHADQAQRDHAVLKAAVGLPSARNPRRRDHMGYASSAKMGKLPFRLRPLQQPRQMLSTLSSR